MTRVQFERLVILFDEWAGICVLLWLRWTHDEAFTWFLIAWAVLVYGVSYPSHWLKIWRNRKS